MGDSSMCSRISKQQDQSIAEQSAKLVKELKKLNSMLDEVTQLAIEDQGREFHSICVVNRDF